LHNKPQGCGASVSSAAGPFTTTKKHQYNETGLNVIADKNIGSEVNVVYKPPDDGLVKAETCVGVEE
jgi:hypothetical protein